MDTIQASIMTMTGQLSTGSKLLDTLLIPIALTLGSWIMTQTGSWMKILWSWVEEKIKRLTHLEFKHKLSIRMDEVESTDGRCNLSMHDNNRFLLNGILRVLNTAKEMKQCRELDIMVDPSSNYETTREKYDKAELMALPTLPILYNGMRIEFQKTCNINSKERDTNMVTNLCLQIYTNDVDKARAFMSQSQSDYVMWKYPPEEKEQLYFFSMTHGSEDKNWKLEFTRRPFISSRSFKSIFIPQKQQLMNMIADFETRRGTWDPASERAYKLLMVLYGEPGCGKTSLIKAIARTSGRHIISLRLKDIPNDAELSDALNNPLLTYRTKGGNCTINVPIAKRFYLFEDMDCTGVDAIIKPRGLDEKKFSGAAPEKSDKHANLMQMFKMNEGITLSGILNEFDGANELHGAMGAITTNHIEKFDKALLRPGRMDIILHLTYITGFVLGEMLRYHYSGSETSRAVTDKVYRGLTPAKAEEIIQISKAESPHLTTAEARFLAL